MADKPAKKSLGGEVFKFIVVVVGLFIAVSYIGNRSSKAEPVLVSTSSSESSRIIDGEPDYGVLVTLVVKNDAAEPGDVKVRAFCTSSEGEWEREQTIRFEADETRTLEYFFHEPTVNATNIQTRHTVKKASFF